MNTPLESYLKSIVRIAVLEALTEFRGAAPASQPPAPPTATQSPPPAASAAAPEAVTTYEPIGALIKKLCLTNKPGVIAILGEFGAKKGGELKQADWQPAYTKLKALEGTS